MPAPLPDWTAIDTVLLDMDGTLLDLRFDNRFWLEVVPARYATANGLTVEESKVQLAPRFMAKRGTLDWYCLDYWSRELELDLAAIKREVSAEIGWLPYAEAFVRRVRARGKRVALVTNAHPQTLAVKNDQLDFAGHFDAVYSSHAFGAPKEAAQFWPRFAGQEPFVRERTLFVDDSVPVLRAARGYGIRWVYAVARPDSTLGLNESHEFPAVESVHQLMPE